MDPQLRMRLETEKQKVAYERMIHKMNTYSDDGARLGPCVEKLYGNKRRGGGSR